MNVDKVISKVCKSDGEKELSKKVCKLIRENSSQKIVSDLFDCLDGSLRLDEVEEENR